MRIRVMIVTVGMAAALMLSLGSRRACFAVGETIPGYVTYLVEDTIYIEIVGEHHVKVGDTGVVKIRGRDAAYVRVYEAGPKYLYLQVISQSAGVQLNTGDSIVFEIRSRAHEIIPSQHPSKWQELDKLILGGELDLNTTSRAPTPLNTVTFENETRIPAAPPISGSTETAKAPLLNTEASEPNVALVLKPVAIAAATKAGNSQDANLFHGRLRNREIYQTTHSPATHTLESRVDFDGSVERLNASPWSLVWSGNESYRNGNTGQTAPDYKHPRLNVYNAMLARRNDDGGSTKLGRLLPSELPGMGFLDGGQLEHVFSPEWRAGGMLALRPDRITLDPTTKEPLQSAYASTEQGTHGDLYYSGTLGLYHTFYRGTSDELALLTDQRADLGPKLSLFSSSQIDFNGGAQQVHKGPRIIRLDLFGNSPVTPTLNVRAGLSHFERPDDAAERDLTAGTTQGFDLGFWRYFVGANRRLPFNISLDVDLSVINSATAPTDRLWRVTMSRFGLFFLPRGQISISAYNVTSAQGRGFGFQTTASTPLWSDKVSLNLSSSSQYSSVSSSPKTFDINDASVRLNWSLSRAWNADIGVTQSYASGQATSTVADSSVGFRW